MKKCIPFLFIILTGCAGPSRFDRIAHFEPTKPIYSNGYSEQLTASSGSYLAENFQVDKGMLVGYANHDTTINVQYNDKSYPVYVKALNKMNVIGSFDWFPIAHLSESNVNKHTWELMPIAGKGVIPGVDEVGLAVGTDWDGQKGVVRYVVLLKQSDSSDWYVIMYDKSKLPISGDFSFKIDNTTKETYKSAKTLFLGVKYNGTLTYACNAGSRYGSQGYVRVGSIVQTCGRPIVVDGIVGEDLIKYRYIIK